MARPLWSGAKRDTICRMTSKPSGMHIQGRPAGALTCHSLRSNGVRKVTFGSLDHFVLLAEKPRLGTMSDQVLTKLQNVIQRLLCTQLSWGQGLNPLGMCISHTAYMCPTHAAALVTDSQRHCVHSVMLKIVVLSWVPCITSQKAYIFRRWLWACMVCTM